MIPTIDSARRCTQIIFDPSPGGVSLPGASIWFDNDTSPHQLSYTAKALADLPLTLMNRVIANAEWIWAEQNLERRVAASQGANRATLVEWTPRFIEWRLHFLCSVCTGNGGECCDGTGEEWHGLPFYTDIDGCEIDPVAEGLF